MKPAATISLLFNALLLALLGWRVFTGSHLPERAAEAPALTHRVPRASPPTPLATTSPGELPELVQVNEPFHWAQLESTDYREYVARLRDIGCPEPTVRDLVVADVNELFVARVRELVDAVSRQFWSVVVRQQEFEKLVETKYKELQSLEEEREAIFRALFDADDPHAAEQEERQAADRRASWEELADFLPAEKRQRFVEAKQEFERAWADFVKTNPSGKERQAGRSAIEAAHLAGLGEWLTPGELAELRLRESKAAALRHRLVGMDLSETEARLAARLQTARDEAKPGQGDSAGQVEEEQLRELLGSERYAAFIRAGDPRFASFHRVAERLELPAATAAQGYDIRRQTEETARRLRADAALSPEERERRLNTLREEAARNLKSVLGEPAFAAYSRLDSQWLDSLPERR